MSRYTYRTKTATGVSVEVCMGWDPPLEYYFMTVMRYFSDDPDGVLDGAEDEEGEDETDDEVLYSNLNEKDPFQPSLVRYLKVLDGLGITLPSEMIIAASRLNNREVKDYTCK